jgi:hypothetical protein
MSARVYVTEEPFNTVVGWYRETLSGRPGYEEETSSLEDQEIGIFYFELDDAQKMITVTRGGKEHIGQTVISVCSSDDGEIKSR